MMVAVEMEETVQEHLIQQTNIGFPGYPGFRPYDAGTQKNLPFTAVPKRENIGGTILTQEPLF